MALLSSRIIRRFKYRPFIDVLKLNGNERVLDFGSGWGDNTLYLSDALDKGGKVTALDVSSEWQKVLKDRLNGRKNVRCVKADVRNAGLADSSFDVIVVHYVMHDISEMDRMPITSELAKKLKPGGFIHLKEPTGRGHGMPISEIRSLMNGNNLIESRAIERRGSFQADYTKEK